MPEEHSKNYALYRGRCKPLAEELMFKSGGRLRLVRGHYYCPVFGEQAHWWCVDKTTGAIEDPTALQFPSSGSGEYVEFNGIYNCEQCGRPVPEKDMVPAGTHPMCSNACAMYFVGLSEVRPKDYEGEE